MSSEPMERRVTYIGDRLKSSRCPICGKEYFKPRKYCGNCGRKSLGKMEEIDLFYEKGVLETCTIIREPTNKFMKLAPLIYGIISFHNGKIRVPGRLTDVLLMDNMGINLDEFEGREVVPRFRRRHSVGKSDIIPTTSLAFTFADEYYPYQRYEIIRPNKEYDTPGIVGYGAYVSRFRIKEATLERSVPFIDEDAITAAVEAGKLALIHSGVDGRLIGKVYVGTESNPYAVNPIASKVAQVLNLGEEDADGVQMVDAVDTEFACKAASSMFKDAMALTLYPKDSMEYVMVIGADNAQAAPRCEPGGELDYFVGYGGAAFIFGRKDVIAEIEGWCSCTSDTPDFWRRDLQPYPRHGGRFTGEPAYFKHIIKAGRKLMDKMSLKPSDIDYFACHQPNPTFPVRVAMALGFKIEQYLPGIQVTKFGNTYASSSLISLAAVLDQAEPHKRIMVVGYGSGAGSDAYVFVTTSQIRDKRSRQHFTIEYQAENKFINYINYAMYRMFKEGL
ncbi:MAG: hydroxymethylglutaryl-CoA synthase [Thermoproteota archaeon]